MYMIELVTIASAGVVATIPLSEYRMLTRRVRLTILVQTRVTRLPVYLSGCRLFGVEAVSKDVGNI